MRSAGLLALPLLAATACASGVDSAVFVSAPPVPAEEDVRIYRAQLPSCPFDELGLVTWRPVHSWAKLQSGVEKMRARAREMGGQAIIGFSMGERANGTTTTIVSDSSTVSVGSRMETETRVSGTVIRFRDADCRS